MQHWDDEDIPLLLEWVDEQLAEGILSLSSFERYKKELLAGSLNWSPLHDQVQWAGGGCVGVLCENAKEKPDLGSQEKLMHTALPLLQESFWLENSERLVDNNCQLLRVLMKLIETSRDTTTLAVACHDLAQIVAYYPHGARRRHRGRRSRAAGSLVLHSASSRARAQPL